MSNEIQNVLSGLGNIISENNEVFQAGTFGGGLGAVCGALVGGPIGAVIGGALGAGGAVANSSKK